MSAGSEFDFDTSRPTAEMAGSPFTIVVVAATPDPTNMLFTGFVSSVTAGEFPLINIQQRDEFGNFGWDVTPVTSLEAIATIADGSVDPQTYRVSTAAADTWTVPIGPLRTAGTVPAILRCFLFFALPASGLFFEQHAAVAASAADLSFWVCVVVSSLFRQVLGTASVWR